MSTIETSVTEIRFANNTVSVPAVSIDAVDTVNYSCHYNCHYRLSGGQVNDYPFLLKCLMKPISQLQDLYN